MINPSGNPHDRILLIDDSEGDLLWFGRMLRSVIADEKMNMLPKAGWEGFCRTLKFPDGVVHPEILIR